MVLVSDPPEADLSELVTWIGREIDGRYRVTEIIGQGGMGAVFAAVHLGLHKEVALKVVRPEHAGNAAQAARFTREAMVTSRIDHPNVISAIDYATLPDGTAYLAMQLVRGPSLKEIRGREGALPWPRVADLGAQIADALLAASSHGIVHRDLKPENVLVEQRSDATEIARVLDFGIAKFTRDSLAPPPMREAQHATNVGIVVGTPGYMAPEQVLGRGSDHRSDLYALGVILWECIVGRALWQGEDIQAVIQSQFSGPAPLLRSVASDPSVPEDLERLVADLLAERPEKRLADAGLVRDALRKIAADGRRRDPTHPRMLLNATATPLSTQTIPPGPRSPTSRLVAALAAGSLLVAIAWLVIAPRELMPWGGGGSGMPSAAARPKPSVPPPLPEAPEPGATGLPSALEPHLQTLIQAESRDERVAAATALLGHVPMSDVPKYVRSLAHFQLAASCNDKKDELARIAALREPRTLPALVLSSERARHECAPRKDCFACMRDELEALILELREIEPH